MSKVYFNAKGIDHLLSDVLEEGVWIHNERTGTNVLTIFDAKIVIEEEQFPFITNRAASPRLGFEELWFFLNGRLNTEELEEKGVHFWSGNTSPEFLFKVGLGHLPKGHLGAAYSSQIRNSGGYCEILHQTESIAKEYEHGVDQLKNLLEGLKKDPYGRRHLINLWNPSENHLGVLTPCWYNSTYVVLPDGRGNDVLHVKLNNRSLDKLFGDIHAIQQYRLFQMALCKMFNFKLGRLSCDLSNVHLYENQIEYVKELLTREYSYQPSSISLEKEINTLEDLLSIKWSDWNMVYNYNKDKFKTPRPEMVS